jgi:hypothetical protein
MIKMEYARACMHDIDMLVTRNNAICTLPFRALTDDPQLYILTSRDADKALDGYAVYRLDDKVATRVDHFAITPTIDRAIAKAAQGLLRWKKAVVVV